MRVGWPASLLAAGGRNTYANYRLVVDDVDLLVEVDDLLDVELGQFLEALEAVTEHLDEDLVPVLEPEELVLDLLLLLIREGVRLDG